MDKILEHPIQIAPLHIDYHQCYKDELVEHMCTTDLVIAQRKYDGERCLLHFNHNQHWATSRRTSKKTGLYQEFQDCLPYLDDINLNLGYTVLDSECYGKDWSESAGVLHSLPVRARELQANGVVIKNAVFDCLYYDGEDISNKPYSYRYEKAKEVVELLNSKHIHIVENEIVKSFVDCEEKMNKFISEGYEGAVIKDMTAPYSQNGNYIKFKQLETVDVVVYDYKMGRGKYKDTVGALEVGYYDETTGKIVHICSTNPGPDANRDLFLNNWSELKNVVVELKCQCKTKTSLRHPRFSRLRKDKDYTMCTYSSIFGNADN